MNTSKKLTIIHISPILGIAVKREIKLSQKLNDQWCYTVRGNAKEYFLSMDEGLMIFEGWTLPLHLDNETCFLGPKEQYNFVTAYPNNLLKLLDRGQINTRFNRHHLIFYQHPENRDAPWMPLFKKAKSNQ